MAIQTILAPLGTGHDAANQVSISATGSATAGSITVIVPDGTTNQDLVDALQLTIDACLRDPTKFRAH